MLKLATNIHSGIENILPGETYLVSGNYKYYHYLCDGFDDRGWGCAYRTLQTICSWLNENNYGNNCEVPSIRDIQNVLVELEDKPKTFLGSKQWIGSVEVCHVIDKLYDIPCKILHVPEGGKLCTIVENLKKHFVMFGSPLMMGGDMDCSSKGVIGLSISDRDNASLLIVDPHYIGKLRTNEFLQKSGWVKWVPLRDFLNTSFYNLCLPQAKALQLLQYNS